MKSIETQEFPKFSPDKEKTESESKKKEFLERLKSIIKVVSRKPNLVVTTEIDLVTRLQLMSEGKNPEQTWFRHKRGDTEYVHIPAEIFQNEDDAMGIACHEAGHVLITRVGQIVPEEVLKEVGFTPVLMTCEERPTDEVIKANLPGAKKWLENARKSEVAKMFESRSSFRANVPDFMQLCSLITYRPYMTESEVESVFSPEVNRIYNKIESDVVKIEKDLPKNTDREEEIVKRAVSRYSRTYKSVWPKVRSMIELGTRNKELENVLKDLLSEKGDVEGKGEGDSSFPSVPQEVVQEVKQKVEKMLEDLNKEEIADKKEQIDEVKKDIQKLGEQTDDKRKETLEDIKQKLSDLEGVTDDSKQKSQIDEAQKALEDIEANPDKADENAEKLKQSVDKLEKEIGKDNPPGQSSQPEDSDPKNKVEEGNKDQENEMAEGGNAPEQGDPTASDKDQAVQGEPMGSDKENEQGGQGDPVDSDKDQEGQGDPVDGEAQSDSDSPVSSIESIQEKYPKQTEINKLIRKKKDEVVKNIKDLLDQMPETERVEIEEKARQEIKEILDQLTEKLRPKLDEDKVKTVSEIEEGEALSDAEGSEGQSEEISYEDKPMSPDDSKRFDVFEKTYSEIREFDDFLYERLERIFHPNMRAGVIMKDSGSRINMQRVIRRESSKESGVNIDNKIFESKRIPEKKDYFISILVDLSGSMSRGGKIEETFKGVVLLCEVLNRLGISFEINGFQDEVIRFKKEEENFDDMVRSRVGGMVAEVDNRNAGGHNNANFNDDGPCLMEVAKSVEGNSRKSKFIVVLSDGLPSGRRSDADDLKAAVREINTRGEVKLVAIGLGSGTEHVSNFYPNSKPNVKLSEFPEVISDLLEEIITNPNKFIAKQ